MIHPNTVIGDDVTIYPGVTLGRSDIWRPGDASFIVGDHAILGAGAALLAQDELRVGTGTVIGANAVLTQSTGEWEVWAGSPARKIGERDG